MTDQPSPIHICERHGLRITCPLCGFQAQLRRAGVVIVIQSHPAAHTGATLRGWCWQLIRGEVGDDD